jgi:transcriptional regulator with XRE-family HTH domain
MSFAKHLAAARQRQGLSQQQVADRLGVMSAETISRYERGEREPRLSTIVKMAEALRVHPVELIDGQPVVAAREANPVGNMDRGAPAFEVDVDALIGDVRELAQRSPELLSVVRVTVSTFLRSV